ncbi:tape measure protein [Enterococcus sp. AZ163]|uniref:tape measure protein n=1 Tax=Enterococcus sp. AZ163 TaxID=2774638 RepID=UPI003D2A4D19
MAASGVGQFSINVKSNLRDFYGQLTQAQRSMKELTDRKNLLQVDSSQLDKLRDKSQRIAAEMKELRQQKTEIKLGMKDNGEISKIKKEISGVNTGIDNINKKKLAIKANPKSVVDADGMLKKLDSSLKTLQSKKISLQADLKHVDNTKEQLKELDRNIASLNRQKLEVDAEIQPIRTANVEIHKIDQEIDRINAKKIDIKVSDSLKSIGNTMSKAGDTILSKFNPLTSKLNQMFGFGLINNLVDKGINMVTGSVDSAIARYDTLNNFEKVMSNMNIGSDAAANSKQTLIEGLDGLPTALDAGVSAVQRFTSKNKDIEKSTQMFLAVNNAMLAGGTSAETQAGALEQLSQGYSKGKFEMDEWKTITNAMPAQLDQIALSFGKTGSELYDALQSGNISMDEFMDRVITLNTEGAEGFKSFSEQAKNAVGGIQTGVSRMKSAVTRGVADVITTIDEIAKDNGLGGISDILYNVGKSFENGLKSISKFIKDNQNQIFEFFNSIYQFLSKLDYGGFIQGLGSGLKTLAGDFKAILSVFKPLLNVVSGEGNAEKLGKLIPRIFELGVALKVLGGITKGAGGVVGFFEKFGAFKFPSFGFGGKEGVPLKSVGINDLKSLGLKMLTIAGLAGNIWLAAKSLQEVDKIKIDNNLPKKLLNLGAAVTAMGAFSAIVGGILKIPGAALIIGSGAAAIAGLSLTLMTTAKAVKSLDDVQINGEYIQKIEQIGEVLTALSVTSGGLIANNIFTIIGNAGAMINDWLKEGQLKSFARMANTINQIADMEEVKGEDVKAKLRSIDDVVAVLSEDRTTVDYIPFVNYLKTLAEIGDTIRDYLKAGQLKAFVETMKSLETLQGDVEIDTEKIKANIETIKKCLEVLGDSEKEISLQNFDVAVIKKLFEVISSWAGALEEKGNASKLKALVGMMKSFETIGESDIDPKKIGKTFKKIKESVEEINKSGIGSITEMTKSGGSFKKVSEAIESLKEITENINGLASYINVTDIKVNISILGELVNEINKAFKELMRDDKKTDIKELNKKMESLDDVMSKMASIVENAGKSTGNIDYTALTANLSVIQHFFDDVSNKLYYLSKSGSKKGSLKLEDTLKKLEDLEELMEKMGSLVEKAQNATGNIDGTALTANVDVIKTFFDEVSNKLYYLSKSGEKENSLSLEAVDSKLEDLKEIISKMGSIVTKAQDAAGNIDGTSLFANLDVISQVFDKVKETIGKFSNDQQDNVSIPTLATADFGSTDGNQGLDDALANLEQALTALDKMGEIVQKAQAAIGFIDKEAIISNLTNVSEIFTKIQEVSGTMSGESISQQPGELASIGNSTFNNTVDNGGIDGAITKMEQMLTALDKMRQIIEAAQGAVGNVNGEAVAANISAISSTLSKIKEALVPFAKGGEESFNLGNVNSKLGTLSNTLGKFPDIIAKARAVEGQTVDITSTITSVKTIFEQLQGFKDFTGEDSIFTMVQAFQTLVITLDTMSNEFFPIGKSYGQKIVEGFKSVDFEAPALEKIRKLLDKLRTMNSGFNAVGRQVGQAFSDGITSKMNEIDLSGFTEKIRNAINSALAGKYSTKIEVELVTTETRQTSTSQSSNSSSSRLPRISDANFSSGGLISVKPGNKARIQDSPEKPLLDNGEYVIPKKIVDAVGMPFLEKLRSGQISRTFAGLAQSVSHTTSSVVNNVYHNNNTQNLNLYTSGNQDAVLAANRRFRIA